MAGDPRVGSTLGRYRIEGVLGRGGMSVVYLATDPRLNRRVALKVMGSDLADDPVFRDRFIRESELAASLDHPNVIPIYEAGESDGQLFIAMRYVEGTDLRTVIQESAPLRPDRTLALVAPVAGALDAAHARGLVHRDVKPANILIARLESGAGEHVYLTDFGITKRTTSVSGLTRTGQLMGTIDYVAPEQVRGRPVDGRADQYSLACVAFECLSGSPPFPKDSEMAVLWAHVNDPPPSVRDSVPDAPPALDEALKRAMSKEPGSRFASCSEFVAALAPVEDRTRAADTRPESRGTRRRVWWAGAAAVLAIAGVLTVWLTRSSKVPDARSSSPGPSAPASDGGFERGVTRLDLASNRKVTTVPVINTTTEVAIGGGFVWATDSSGLAKINPATNVQVGDLPGNYLRPTGGPDGVWVFDTDAGTIERIDPETNEPHTLTRVIAGISDMTYWEGFLWYANARGAQGPDAKVVVVRVDPQTGKNHVFDPTSAPGGCSFEGCERSILAMGGGAAWYINEQGTLTRLDVETGEDQPVSVPKVRGVAFGDGSVWVLLANRAEVIQLDPERMEQLHTIPVGPDSVSIVAGQGSIWVVSRGDQSVWRIDTTTRATTKIVVGAGPGDVAVDEEGAWIAR